MPQHSACLTTKTEMRPGGKARAHRRRQAMVVWGQVRRWSVMFGDGALILLAKGIGHAKVQRIATGTAPDTVCNKG
jgi:hypothetical protein